MRIYLTKTADTPKKMLEHFKKSPLDFLYHQEDRTEYKVKTISYLIDEIQNLSTYDASEENFLNRLSKAGRRRYNTILNQLNYLVEFGW